MSQHDVAEQCRILLVDDSEDIVEVYTEVLELSGHAVRTASDGARALDVANEHRPQLALLDLGLPVMDGFAVARRLRERFGGEIMLVSLSGWGGEDVSRRSREAGFDRHLTKPAGLWQLRALVSEALQQNAEPVPPAP